MLDGRRYTAPRELGAGPHEFVPQRNDVWTLESARAAALGYTPLRAPAVPSAPR
jgi:hypothetical protein